MLQILGDKFSVSNDKFKDIPENLLWRKILTEESQSCAHLGNNQGSEHLLDYTGGMLMLTLQLHVVV